MFWFPTALIHLLTIESLANYSAVIAGLSLWNHAAVANPDEDHEDLLEYVTLLYARGAFL